VYHRLAAEFLFDSTVMSLRRILGDSIAFDTTRVRDLVKQATTKPVTVGVETLRPKTALAP
jgi:hypothetical protein